MERMMGRIAAAAVVLAATMVVFTQDVFAQSARGERAGAAAGGRSFERISDARDLTTGLTLGVYSLVADGIAIRGPTTDGVWSTGRGEGAGVMVGYGFNHTFSAYATLDVAKQPTIDDSSPSGTFGLAQFAIGARANIPLNNARTIPYVSASIANRVLAATATNDYGDTGDVEMSGRGFVLGGGIEHFFSPHMALDAGVEYASGSFDRYKTPDGDFTDRNGNSTNLRLRLGVNWRP